MVINWYGEGCFKIQTGEITLLTDPFENSTGLTPARGKIDITLKTLTGYPPPEKTKDAEQVILGPGEYGVGDIDIKGFQLAKDSTDTYFKTAYAVLAEGLKLGFLGHISEYPEPEILEQLKPVDILFIPAGGEPFIGIESAAKLIKQLEPKIIVGSFFKIPGLKRASADYKDFVKELDQKAEPEEKLVIKKKDLAEQKGIRVVILKP